MSALADYELFQHGMSYGLLASLVGPAFEKLRLQVTAKSETQLAIQDDASALVTTDAYRSEHIWATELYISNNI